ncbi:MAG: hypothetical protein KJ060_03135, partial [Candidatus Hydrogenedentes bacterium]|nr:hypothetical protein [Candidatus Hydrogenedentota bacterium]
MKLIVFVAATLLAAVPGQAQDNVLVPWDELKTLYREKMEREFEESLEKEPQVYSIDEARYRVRLLPDSAEIDVLVSGRSVSGDPAPIPLFGEGAVVTNVSQVTGGTIMTPTDLEATAILPEGEGVAFQLVARLLAQATEDKGEKRINVPIPRALQNALEIDAPAGLQLLEAQGIADAGGVFRFSANSTLSLRYVDTARLEAATVIQVDTLSRISAQRGRTFLTTHFYPDRAVPKSLNLQAPEGAKFLASSLRTSSIRELGHGRYELMFPEEQSDVFSIEWAIDVPDDGKPVTLRLPTIDGNGGQQGRFVLEEPEDGQVSASAEGLVTRIPIERVREELRVAAAGAQFYATAPAENAITLTSSRFQPVSTPTTVLDSQYLFISFEENGNVLSVLVLDVPPDVGPRLELKAVPGAEIWSLTVNGAKKKVYGGDEGTWMIPLDSGQPSHVELAFLQEKEKLGLHGRLEATVPETGLPSQEVGVGIALPARVELLSMEG